MNSNRFSNQDGFTLVELSFVMMIMGLMMMVALPNLARTFNPERDFFTELSLWTEIILERSAFRGEVILVEIDVKEQTIRAVQPVEQNNPFEQESPGGLDPNQVDQAEDPDGAEVSLVEVEDPYFPASLDLPDDIEIEDVQGTDGEKITEDKYYLVFYPNGFVDPLTFHLLDEDRDEHTGYINTVTGKIRWIDGYEERLYDEKAEEL